MVPAKWEYLDSWDEGGYGSLNGKIFYFENGPEEMYYVTYTRDPDKDVNGAVTTTVSVRAVTKGAANRRWNIKDDLSENRAEIDRINERFRKEIITKLEAQMQLRGKMM
jgi:hypothetical protein